MQQMKRADYEATRERFMNDSSETIIGALTANSFFDVELEQRDAWLAVISLVKNAVADLRDAYVFLEFTIPEWAAEWTP